MCMISVVVYYLLRFSTKSIKCQVYVRQFHFRSCSFVINILAVEGRLLIIVKGFPSSLHELIFPAEYYINELFNSGTFTFLSNFPFGLLKFDPRIQFFGILRSPI